MEKLPPGKPAGQAGMTSIFPNGLLGWIAGMIFDALDGLTFGIFNLDALADRLRGTEQKAVQAQETAMTAVDDAAAAAALAAANEEANIANSTAIAEANVALGTKANIEDIPTDVPGFISLNPVDDAVFPSSEMVPLPTIVNGTTSWEYGGENTTHRHDHNATITWVEPIYTTAINRLDLGYINATRDRIYNTVGFTIAEQTVTTKPTVRVGIYKMGKTAAGFPDGNLTLIWISPLSANIQGQFGSAAQDIRVDLGVDIVASKGDWFAVCIVQTGSGTVRNLLGKQTARKNALSGVFPTRLAMTRVGETAPPNTLTPAQLDNSSTWVPWMFMGQSLGLIKISLVDLFDRANASTLGPNWATYGVGMDIVSGVARCKRINRGNLTSRVEDRSQGVYVSQLATDTMSVSVKIDAFDRSHADTEDNPRAQAAVRSNPDMTRFVAVGIRFGLIEIRAYSATNPAGVTKNSTTRTWVNGDVVELRATDDVGTGKTDFTAYVNGSPVLSWTDATSEASKGPAFRRAAFETASTHRGAIISYFSVPSVGVNEWKAKDL
ncbi:hypothetical protein [Rhodococcus sp. PvP104]|uniref:DUF7257 domain-containing protein n=1 Tax=Rhodococcus sp. PvP104 TaxID=2817911 RepID=UPI001AE295FD|nr:hypothetical protein [Rhodococcus sp. PvP104]MBP2522288.1 hypothetical protein [Rhodococcus sp. PvP104]